MGLFIKKQNNNIIEEVKDFLVNELVISKQACGKSERSAENSLVRQLKERFGEDYVKRQCPIGDNLKRKCDVDIFQGQCGIELKLAHHLETRSDEFQRAIGQIACYVHDDRYSNSGVIMLVIGKEAEMSDDIKKLQMYVSYFPRVHFIYKQAQNKTTK